ncbi:MAG: ATP-binding cassette domain-containing protein [Pseudomonadota bacterium]
MTNSLLELSNLSIDVGERSIIRRLNLSIPSGETHVLLGANGSGKSSILSAIMGLDPFKVVAGQIRFKGDDLQPLTTDERARLGIGLAFQRPPRLEGVTSYAFATALRAQEVFGREAPRLKLSEFADRDLMVGFSGGETKRWEVMKLFLQSPDLLLLDEPESGVDLEHIATIGEAVNRLTDSRGDRSALIITHTGLILDHLDADVGHILADGHIVHTGDPKTLFRHIQQAGYAAPAA